MKLCTFHTHFIKKAVLVNPENVVSVSQYVLYDQEVTRIKTINESIYVVEKVQEVRDILEGNQYE